MKLFPVYVVSVPRIFNEFAPTLEDAKLIAESLCCPTSTIKKIYVDRQTYNYYFKPTRKWRIKK